MAVYEQDKVLYEEASNGDKTIILPVTRVNNVEGLGRIANAKYSVGDVVYVDNNQKVALKCTTAGTTSSSELDVSSKAIGASVTDGSVTWQVCNRTSDVTSVNGQTGDVVVDTFPVGSIVPFSGSTVPTGYLTCDGTAVSRIVYADLFSIIGTTYGAGDGSATFNLPNLNNNSFLEGSNTAGTVKSAGLPNITGKVTEVRSNNGYPHLYSGAFYDDGVKGQCSSANGGSYPISISFDASKSNSIYGNSTTVQPKSVTVKFCIKAYGAITNAGSVELENAMKAFEDLQSELDKEAGFIKPYAGDVVPSGYLPCNGSELSRNTYARLFSIIGTTYGAGDGSTTFNLPNLNNNSFLEGSDTAGTVKSAGLPNITGQVRGLDYATNTGATDQTFGAFQVDSRSAGTSAGGGSYVAKASFNASRSSAIYGNSNTVQPKSVTVKFCIKY